MGLKVGEVKLEKHNQRWHQMYVQELDELWQYFGDVAIRISHIGSTAIDGLEAKPIIDIAVALRDLDDFNKVSYKFSSDPEYSIKKDFDNDEILIRKGSELNRKFYIHVMDIDSKRYKNTILFRDTLLHDSRIRDDYRKLKHVLAKKYPNNRKKYTSNKADFIQTTLDMTWAKTTLVPIMVICGISLVSLAASLWARLSLSPQSTIYGLSVFKVSQVVIVFSSFFFIVTLLASIILYRRYHIAKKQYTKIVLKVDREYKKETREK